MGASEIRIQRLLRWSRGGEAGPWSINIYPTNRCNFRCPICWQRDPAYTPHYADEIPDARYLRLIDEAAEAKVCEWSILGGGEPMVRGDLIMEMCERIRRKDMYCYIQTNGSLFTESQLERFVDMGMNAVRVSLDGPNAAINDAIRHESSFERATANLKKLAEIKRRAHSKLPAVSIYMVLTSSTYDKLDQMLEYAASVGAMEVEATTMVVHSEDARRFQLSEQQRAELPQHLKRALERGGELNIHNNFALFYQDAITVDPNAMPGRKAGPDRGFFDAPCFEPWLNMTVLPNGRAGPCCMYDGEYTGDGGSIATSSLMGVWMGPYFQRLRAQALEGRLPRFCATCPSTLFAQQDALRGEARTYVNLEKPPSTALADVVPWLARKTARSLRRHGPRGAIQRGREWFGIHKRGKE
ncbi:MAG TPA: radical SAM protein [Candidatus Hydrogenedentes bacterium]|nr:radical SAM protein [Candidatus Hydrogenedentota bacterium]HPG68221.1 radical SAM protein [Candidatus Hydrogenedentota bacterium]